MTHSLKRLGESAAVFSLIKSTATRFLSLLFPFLSSILSKTLDFFSSMDSFFFDEYDDFIDHRGDPSHHRLRSLSDLDDEPLYLVPYRWWNEAWEALFAGKTDGVLYAVSSSLEHSGEVDCLDSELESEIVLDMRKQSVALKRSDCGDEGSLGCEFGLLSEWMFLRALKWHYDLKDVGGPLVTEDSMPDLFSLQIRLSFDLKTNSLLVKINQKDNAVGTFGRACNLFCVESDMMSIWDFSGQTTQFVINDRKLLSDSSQSDEEIVLDLQVYGSSYFSKGTQRSKDEMTLEHSRTDLPFVCDSLNINGSTKNVNSYFRVNHCKSFGRSSRESCNLGLTGLYNLGNTCFMNSAIQCLLHTSKLVDYFLGDFRKDINFDNSLGMNGKLALAFGELLRKLWSPGAKPVAPRMFKSAVADFAPQFSGYNQHDSQEFLAFLLDGLHEDLNRVKFKSYIEVKDTEGRPDEEVAEEHWQNHLGRNNSIIVDLYQGQYRSTLVCPVCRKLSVTFDPFMYLSLPLPPTTTRTMTLTVLSTDGTTLPLPVTVTVPNYGKCEDLVQALSAACSLREDEKLLVAEVYNNRILHFLDSPSHSVELIRDDDRLVAYRMPKDDDTSPLVVFAHQQEQQSYIQETPYLKKFGFPLVARVPDFPNGADLQKVFLKLLDPFLMPVEDCLNDDYDAESAGDDEMEDVTGTSVLDGEGKSDVETQEILYLDNGFRFYLEDGERYVKCSSLIQMNEPVQVSGPATVNISVTWPDRMGELYDTSLLSSLPEICKPALFATKPRESVSLYKCLDAFLKEEPLGPEDMWYCPNCKKHQQASKKLDLWRLPVILVIHLKRFSYNRFFKNKLETFVEFPIDDFDLSAHIIHKNTQVSHRYMLYAVTNHYGGMGGGHYTAFVQHGHGQWYDFDDSHVFPVSEEQIKTSAAYVLFYKRISDDV